MIFDKGLLTAPEILQLIDNGVIKHADKRTVSGVTLDIHLSDVFLQERKESWYRRVFGTPPTRVGQDTPNFIKTEGYPLRRLDRGAFCIGYSEEYFNLPDDITGFLYMKSTHARAGLNHSQAIVLKPGWSGSLALELTNSLQHHDLMLIPGEEIGQVLFMKHNPVAPYAGKYNNQTQRDA